MFTRLSLVKGERKERSANTSITHRTSKLIPGKIAFDLRLVARGHLKSHRRRDALGGTAAHMPHLEAHSDPSVCCDASHGFFIFETSGHLTSIHADKDQQERTTDAKPQEIRS